MDEQLPANLPSQPQPQQQQQDVAMETESPIRADDFATMKQKLLPQLEDLEVSQEAEFTWEISNWRELGTSTDEPRAFSPLFQCDGYNWRILTFPEGNRSDHVSLYLEATPITKNEGISEDNEEEEEEWSVCAQFGLVMWNPTQPEINRSSHATHRFQADEKDWGFTRFFDLHGLENKTATTAGPMLDDADRVNITAFVKTLKDPTGVLWHNFIKYDSKKETGYVGLKNQGATCYLNSLLQSLYFTQKFRQLVYQIPSQDEPADSVFAALQRCFYLLQNSQEPVGTLQLTRAFGWDSGDAFTQHDVQELERVLMDKLESQIKGTQVEGVLNDMLVGKMKSFIKCVNVDFESSRAEDFWDLQLNVKGMKTLADSFRDYVQVEMLEGENQYQAEGYGLQDAKKGVVFESFPPVLHLQLKRYEYDFMRDCMVKVNDRYEFPLEIDLAPYMEDDKGESWEYALHGVLVHSGDQNAGHYYALIKPTADSDWFRFDDDRVTRATLKEVLEENYGVDNVPPGPMRLNRMNIRRHSSAYMLVYIRKTHEREVLECGEDDIPKHIPERIEIERQEELQKRKEYEEQKYYMAVKLLSNKQFLNYQGFDLGQWDDSRRREGEAWVPEAQPLSLKMRKDFTIAQVYQLVAEQLEINDPGLIRLWTMIPRLNKTYRLGSVLEPSEDKLLEEIKPRAGRNNTVSGGGELQLYIETVEVDAEGNKLLSTDDEKMDNAQKGKSLIFLKYFDPIQQVIRGAGTHTVNNSDTIGQLSEYIRAQMNISEQIRMYEEVKPEMVEIVRPNTTFYDAELSDGDVLCFEQVLTAEQTDAVAGFKTAAEYYDFMNNRVLITFKQRPVDEDDMSSEFETWLSKKCTYEMMSQQVGQMLKVEPSHLQFFTTDSRGMPKSPIKRVLNADLRQWLSNPYAHAYTNTIMYQVLDMSLEELEQKRQVHVNYLTEGLSQEHKYEVLVGQNATTGDVMTELGKKFAEEGVNVDMKDLKRWTVINHRLNFVFMDENIPLNQLSPQCVLYVAKMPAEEAEFIGSEDPDYKIVTVQHFQKDPTYLHGIPFTFVVKRGEVFSDTKHRLQKALGVFDKFFENIKFAVLSRDGSHGPQYLSEMEDEEEDDDDDDEATEGESTNSKTPTQRPTELFNIINPEAHILGLDHYDKSARRGFGQTAIKMR